MKKEQNISGVGVKQEGDSSMERLEYTVNYYKYTMSVYSKFWEVMQ